MKKIIFYGAGNISQALIEGLISAGYDKKYIYFVDRNKSNTKKLTKIGIKKINHDSIQATDLVFLAVKPKDALFAFDEIIKIHEKIKIISLVAGIKSNKFLARSKTIELIRAMPNTSSRFNKGITAIYNKSSSKTTFKKVSDILKKVGILIEVEKEAYIDDFTGLIGSGPAYFFYLLKVYEKRITKLCNGDTEKSNEIITNLLEGIALSISNNNNLDDLISAVASKKGTTEAGLGSFKTSKLSQSFEKGIIRAIKRAKEISKEY